MFEFLVSILVLLFFPGLLIYRIIIHNFKIKYSFVLILAFGLILQISMGLIFYSVESVYQLFVGNDAVLLGYNVFIASSSIAFSIFSMVLLLRDFLNNVKKNQKSITKLVEEKIKCILYEPTFIIFFITLLTRMIYGYINPEGILPDASLYLDASRFLVNDGKLFSNVFNELYHPLYYQTGKIGHVGTVFVFGNWFTFNGVSYQIAQNLMYVVSSISTGLVYILSKILFRNKRITIFSVFITILHPTLLFYSVILYGPEFISTLLTLVFIIFLTTKGEKISSYIFLGILAFLSLFVWGAEFYILIFLLFVHELLKNKQIKRNLIKFVLFVGLPITAITFSSTSSLWVVFFLSYLSFILISRFLFKNKITYSLSGFGFVLLCLQQLIFIRTYAHPELILGPPYHPRAVSVPLNLFSFFSKFNVFSDLLNYYDLLTLSAGLLLLIGFLAFVLYKKRLELPFSYFLIHMPLIIFLNKLQYVSSRFFITETILLIMCSVAVIDYLTGKKE